MIERAVYQLLSSDPVLAGYVAQKIFPTINDRGEPAPYVVYAVPFDDEPLLIDSSVGQSRANIQIDIYDGDQETAKEIAEYIRGSLNGLSANADGHNIQVFICRGCRPAYESDTGLHRMMLEFDCYYH